jgi:hypothetical protein
MKTGAICRHSMLMDEVGTRGRWCNGAIEAVNLFDLERREEEVNCAARPDEGRVST